MSDVPAERLPNLDRLLTPRAATVVACALAVVAGFVDALCLRRLFGVFASAQTGNLVLVGLGLGERTSGVVWRSSLSVVSFVVGVVVAATVGRRLADHRRAPVLLLVEAALLAVAPLGTGAREPVRAPIGGPVGSLLLTLVALALGFQTEVIRHAAAVPLSTTYQTGVLAHLGQLVADSADPDSRVDRHRSSVMARVLAVVVVAYVAGAALGAAGSDRPAAGLGVAAAAAAAVAAASALLLRRPRHP